MIGINNKLRELHENNKEIKVAVVGAGLMGKGMVSQLTLVKGMEPSLVIDRTIEKILDAYKMAGISKDDIVVAKTLEDINVGMERNKFIACDNIDLVSKANLIDVVVDATGRPNAGAKIAMDAINNKKHIVMLNVEADSVIGPILNKLAKEAGVIYTGTAGDEPGSVKEIYDFAEASGFEILAIGKGKNNPIDYTATPDKVKERADKIGLKPSMLAGFIDGTNTMIEMAVMANATGFTPDIRGGHGPQGSANELPGIFSLKEEGGILNKYKVIDYVRGIAPGVFAIVTSKLPQVHNQIQFLSMGAGPNYILYRPYHLTSLETPITIARAAIYDLATIAPMDKQVCDVITVAKKDLKTGETLDGIGEYSVYGSIDTYEIGKQENLVPIGLIDKNTKVKRDIKKGEFITYDMIDLETSTMIYKLRKMQEDMY